MPLVPGTCQYLCLGHLCTGELACQSITVLDAKFVAVGTGQVKPLVCQHIILWHTLAVDVQVTQIVLRLGIAAFGSSVPLSCTAAATVPIESPAATEPAG